MITTAPGATYEAVLEAGVTGLVGTVELGLYDGQGGVAEALSSSAIVETPAGSGVYVGTRTAPATGGQYVLVWSLDGTTDPDQVVSDELLVTTSSPTFASSGSLYVTPDELKEILAMQGESFADLAIEIACEAASRACDGYKSTRFHPVSETRYYTSRDGELELGIDELVSLTALTVDEDGDGVWETTWTAGEDFYLAPANATADDRPSDGVTLRLPAGNRFPRYERAIRIQGTFGWAETPVLVKQAAILIANMLLSSTQGAPLGILVAQADEAVATARLGRIHPLAAGLLDQIPGARRPALSTLRLG